MHHYKVQEAQGKDFDLPSSQINITKLHDKTARNSNNNNNNNRSITPSKRKEKMKIHERKIIKKLQTESFQIHPTIFYR
jgi:hypothetical protein